MPTGQLLVFLHLIVTKIAFNETWNGFSYPISIFFCADFVVGKWLPVVFWGELKGGAKERLPAIKIMYLFVSLRFFAFVGLLLTRAT